MAASVLTFHDGKLEFPEELQHELGLHEGRQLRVVYSGSGKIMLDSSETPYPAPVSAGWRSLEGFLKGASFDLNADLEADRIHESQLDYQQH